MKCMHSDDDIAEFSNQEREMRSDSEKDEQKVSSDSDTLVSSYSDTTDDEQEASSDPGPGKTSNDEQEVRLSKKHHKQSIHEI